MRGPPGDLTVVCPLGGCRQVERRPVPGTEFADLVVDLDPDRPAHTFTLNVDGQLMASQGHRYRCAAKSHRERQIAELFRWPGIELEHAIADADPGIAALDYVKCACHNPEMNALFGGPSLHVGDVALQGHEEPLPRTLGIEHREYAGIGDEAQRRAVGRPLVIVNDVLACCVRVIVVVESLEDPPELVG